MKYLSNIPKLCFSSLNIVIHLFMLVPATYFISLGYHVVILRPEQMYDYMYNTLITVIMIALTLVAVSIITYCVRKIKKGADVNRK